MPQTVKKKKGFFYYSWRGLGYLVRGFLRGLGLTFLLCFLLAVIAYVGLRATFDEERIKSVFVDQLQSRLRRPVQIDRVLLTPHGVKLRGVRVVEKPSVPGQYLLTSDAVLVTVKLSSLPRLRLDLGEVKFVSPYIQLLRDDAGGWNVSDIFLSTHSAQSMPVGRLSLPVSFAAELTVVERGVIKVEDRLKQTSYRFGNVNLAVRSFAVDRPFSLAAECDNISTLAGRSISTTLALEGAVSLAGFDWSEAYLRANKLVLTVDGRTIQGTAGLTGLPPTEIDVEASFPDLGPQDWRRYFDKELDLSLPASRWQLKAAVPAPRRIRIRRLHVESPPLSASAMGSLDFSSAPATVNGEVSVVNFPLSQAEVFYPRWRPLALRGMLTGFAGLSGPLSRLQLERGSLAVSRAGGQFSNFAVNGGDVSVTGSDGLEKFKLSVENGQGALFASPFSDLSVSATLDKADLKVERFNVRFIDSRLALKARVRNLADPKEVSVLGSVDRLRWEEAHGLVSSIVARVSTQTAPAPAAQPRTWVRTFKYVIPKKFPDTIGQITIGSVAHKNFAFNNVDLLWDIRGISPSLNRVSGDVKVSFGPGRVADVPAVQAANKFLRIIFLPFVYMHKMNNLSVFSTATAYPKTLDFNRIEGEYGLNKGVATTRLFYVDSPQVVAFADGAADFGKETVNMMILTRLTGYRQPLPEWWVDELGRPAIAFRVKGDLNLPDLDPRLSKMTGDEIEKALDGAKAKAKKRYAALEKLREL
ncbi:MAG TPA: hypothetical protein DEB40_06905 [Elusimicrobia bacterium]|nr:hypothetical protein [Elusimicrobiota bacterium]HBT61457.1 hypothetical protein [Elusimicrobiota bacterium]